MVLDDPVTDRLQLPATNDLHVLIRMLNRHHRIIVERLDHIQGISKQPVIHDTVQMQGNQIKNVARSTAATDVITRIEVEEAINTLQQQIDDLRNRLRSL